MLFRRLAQHVKDQNWTAVGLDFAIVVMGVFIGIQVANWNTAVQDRVNEQRLLTSLYQDIVQAQAFLDGQQDRRPISMAFMTDAYEKIMAEDTGPLSDEECTAIFASGISGFRFPMLATLDSAQGIGDQRLRDAIASYAKSVEQVEHFLDTGFHHSVEMGQAFPDLIQLGNYIGELDELRVSVSCDLESMRADQRFKNAFAYNRDIQDSLDARMVLLYNAFSSIRSNLERTLEANDLVSE